MYIESLYVDIIAQYIAMKGMIVRKADYIIRFCNCSFVTMSETAQRSEWLNMLSLSDCDKVCVNTYIEPFDKVNNCLISDWFTNLF